MIELIRIAYALGLIGAGVIGTLIVQALWRDAFGRRRRNYGVEARR
jgi:hypothetical protein